MMNNQDAPQALLGYIPQDGKPFYASSLQGEQRLKKWHKIYYYYLFAFIVLFLYNHLSPMLAEMNYELDVSSIFITQNMVTAIFGALFISFEILAIQDKEASYARYGVISGLIYGLTTPLVFWGNYNLRSIVTDVNPVWFVVFVLHFGLNMPAAFSIRRQLMKSKQVRGDKMNNA